MCVLMCQLHLSVAIGCHHIVVRIISNRRSKGFSRTIRTITIMVYPYRTDHTIKCIVHDITIHDTCRKLNICVPWVVESTTNKRHPRNDTCINMFDRQNHTNSPIAICDTRDVTAYWNKCIHQLLFDFHSCTTLSPLRIICFVVYKT